MRILSLVEDWTARDDLKRTHGMCLYIQTAQHKILFDVGPDDTFMQNAEACGIDLKAVDTLILSHGHKDHGGGLGIFLQLNHTAKIYARPEAFTPHYCKMLNVPFFCGLDSKYQNKKQIVYTDSRYIIDRSLILFSDIEGNRCIPTLNHSLQKKQGKQRVADDFVHEQNLVILENGKVVVIGGCAHRGIVNIIEQAYFLSGKPVDVVVAGFHLTDPISKKTENNAFLDRLAYNLKKHSCLYYTCHCTGHAVFEYLQRQVGENLRYLALGDEIIIE